MNVLMAAVIASALTMIPAIASAKTGESVHLRLGIVGADDLSRSAAPHGVRVIEVFGPRSLRGGLRRGDIVLRLDGRRIHDGEELAEALEDLGNGSFSVEVRRRGQLRELCLPREHQLVSGDVGDRRWVIRDVVRNIRRDVIWDPLHRHRDVVVLRAQLRDAAHRLRQRLRELEWRFEAEGWR